MSVVIYIKDDERNASGDCSNIAHSAPRHLTDAQTTEQRGTKR